MKAELIIREREVLSEVAFTEIVVWRLPIPAKGSVHSYKYRLALVINGECVLRYDNEAGKGDHRHAGHREKTYTFTTPEALLADFDADVERMIK